MRRALTVAALGLLIQAACGSGPKKVGGQPRWRKVEGTTVAGSKHVATTITFTPTSSASPRYNDPPFEDAPSTPLGDAITAAIDEAARAAGVDPPLADGRLFAAADEIAEVVPDEGVVPYPLVEFAMQHHGIIEPSPHLLVIWGPLDDPQAIVEQLAPRLPELLETGGPLRLGVGSAPADGGGKVVVALQTAAVTTRPIDRALPEGGVLHVDGEVAAAYADPEVYVTREDGTVARPRSSVSGSQTKFSAEVDCEEERGRLQVEITATGTAGPSVLANFPVWCNEDAPTAITVHASEDDTRPVATEEEAEERMLELVNRDRADANLPPLAWDERAAEVARAHSTEMRDTGNVAHVSSTTGTAADRVKASGIKSAAVLENIARAYGVSEAESGLMNSPGHRANLHSTEVTHVGIGIVFGEEVAGRREMFVTQVFIRITPPVDVDAVTEQVRTAMGEVRELGSDKDLDKIAKTLADAIAAGKERKTASAAASKSLEKLASRYSRVGSVITTVSDLTAIDASSMIGEAKSTTHLGIGVAQGTHDELGEGAIFIVLLLGVAR